MYKLKRNLNVEVEFRSGPSGLFEYCEAVLDELLHFRDYPHRRGQQYDEEQILQRDRLGLKHSLQRWKVNDKQLTDY